MKIVALTAVNCIYFRDRKPCLEEMLCHPDEGSVLLRDGTDDSYGGTASVFFADYPIILSVASFFLLLSILMLYLVRNVQTATSEFSGKGIVAIPSVLIYAVLKTSLKYDVYTNHTGKRNFLSSQTYLYMYYTTF